ncbi:multiple inositol polyphosphate phosphatase 1-like [Bombina bombina]|uniref:multiple inositol polyphosphate phosphatase 1-like n=1 Tax=Bombina bombina TaxID=8345 RepID=UPI00235AAEB7|nr:multiple inositol polyphosphate phosphatase 1-like [Bombina bombina]
MFFVPVSRRCFPLPAQIILISVTWFCSSGQISAPPDPPKLASYFGTKTRYEQVNPYLLENPLLTKIKQDLLPGTCTPLQIVSVIRHGTRYPTSKQIKKMKKIHSLILQQSDSQSKLVKDLQKWDMWYDEWMDGQLVKKGEEDMKNLAYRLASVFPSLFTAEKFKTCSMKFITSSKHRCVDSTKSFVNGLVHTYFGIPKTPEGELEDLPCKEVLVNDTLMRFFDHCEKFVVEVEDNDTAMHQVDKFKESPEMMKVVHKISARLGVPESELTADLIQVAFFTCSFELAINNVPHSPWCDLFDEEDALVLEYLNDLKQYWKRGYGYDINSRSSCSLFQHIFMHLDYAVSESRRA